RPAHGPAAPYRLPSQGWRPCDEACAGSRFAGRWHIGCSATCPTVAHAENAPEPSRSAPQIATCDAIWHDCRCWRSATLTVLAIPSLDDGAANIGARSTTSAGDRRGHFVQFYDDEAF